MNRVAEALHCLNLYVLGGPELCRGLLGLVSEILAYNYEQPQIKLMIEQSPPMTENSGFYLPEGGAAHTQTVTFSSLLTLAVTDPLLVQHARNLFMEKVDQSVLTIVPSLPAFTVYSGLVAQNPTMSQIFKNITEMPLTKDDSDEEDSLAELFDMIGQVKEWARGILMVDIGGPSEGCTPARIRIWPQLTGNHEREDEKTNPVPPLHAMKLGKELPTANQAVGRCLRYACALPDNKQVMMPVSVDMSLTRSDEGFGTRHALQVHSIAVPYLFR